MTQKKKVEKKKVEKKMTKKEERYEANCEQLNNVLDTAVEQGSNLDVLYDELIRFAEGGYFGKEIQVVPLLNQHRMNNLSAAIVLDYLKDRII